MRQLLVPAAALPAHPLLAHDGHGLGLPLLHALDHALFVLAALAICGAVLWRYRARRATARERSAATVSGENPRAPAGAEQ